MAEHGTELRLDRRPGRVGEAGGVGEVTEREPHDGYLILQGGVPEVQDFLGEVWR